MIVLSIFCSRRFKIYKNKKMAVPKQRHNQSRRDRRRGSIFTKTPTLVKCPKCGKPVVPHTICGFCGSYRGRDYLSVVAKTDKSVIAKEPKAKK
jgi:large subunit ribosomal protein L32